MTSAPKPTPLISYREATEADQDTLLLLMVELVRELGASGASPGIEGRLEGDIHTALSSPQCQFLSLIHI